MTNSEISIEKRKLLFQERVMGYNQGKQLGLPSVSTPHRQIQIQDSG